MTERNIIYQNENIIIFYLNPCLEKYVNLIYVVPDPIDTHRYFVGIENLGSYTNILITGLFVYFNSLDNMTNKMIIPKI